MWTAIGEQYKVSPPMVLYLISSMQIGVGILGFERDIVRDAGFDSWAAILLAGVGTNIIFWMMSKMMERSDGTIFSVHENLFGKIAGSVLSLAFLCYTLSFVVIILRTYIEVIQVWMFPQVSVWMITIIFLLLCHSFVTGGFRTVTGLCFLGTIVGIPLLLAKYFPLLDANYTNLLPLLNHSPKALLMATKNMSLSYMGFELYMIFYPFIKNPKEGNKWGHFGLIFTVSIYFVTAIVSFVYFNPPMIMQTLWPTLTLWKIVSFPLFERFEYIGITMWLFIILPNLCLGIWCVIRGLKVVTSLEQKFSITPILIIIFIGCILIKTREGIQDTNKIISMTGFYFLYLYIPLIFIYQWIRTRRKGAGQ